MLNLLDYISKEDNEKIKNYIETYMTEEGYCGNDTFLRFWAESKKKLFHLLGGQLIVKYPFSYTLDTSTLNARMGKLYNNHKEFFNSLSTKLNENYHNSEYNFYDGACWVWDCHLFNSPTFDNVSVSLKVTNLKNKRTFKIQKGMKRIRAIQKFIQFFELHELEEEFEQIRLEHSMILNTKEVKGNLCLSIHPLDFLTMSDNDNSWQSCMSWSNTGCYRLGTLEMMDSNNVICCYLETEDDDNNKYLFERKQEKANFKNEGNPEWYWNNKQWRQLFYITKDIAVGGKAYPYQKKEFTLFILEKIKELTEKNLKRTYSFGPELYLDMIHIGRNDAAMRITKDRIAKKDTFKHNIIFDTKRMYNDMFNDTKCEYWCIRNKVKKTTMVSISGKIGCACCGNQFSLEEDSEWDSDYNDRYENTSKPLCPSCYDKRDCYFCHNEEGIFKTVDIYNKDGIKFQICTNCFNRFSKCPCCNKYIYRSSSSRTFLIKDSKEYQQAKEEGNLNEVIEKNVDFDSLPLPRIYLCEDCLDKYTIKVKRQNGFYWQHLEYSFMFYKDEKEKEELEEKGKQYPTSEDFENKKIVIPNRYF